MNIENVCRHNKLGYCKFQKKCKSIHVNEVCEDHSCDIQKCDFRHPKTCRFCSEYRRCKYGEWCCYKHEEKSKNVLDFNYEEIVDKVNQLEKQMEVKDSIIETLLNKM